MRGARLAIAVGALGALALLHERAIAATRTSSSGSAELPPETAAYYIVQLCAMTGMNPDTSFDDLWKFMHIKGI